MIMGCSQCFPYVHLSAAARQNINTACWIFVFGALAKKQLWLKATAMDVETFN